MAEMRKKSYKYCIVPMCESTTVKNPNKLFFHVPNDMNQRKKWCKLMRRDLIGPKTTSYVCEDHFDVENDTENLVKYRLVGGTLKLKVNLGPHKFDCQKAVKPKKQQGPYEKRRRIEFLENIITKEVPSTSSPATSFQSFEMIECDKMEFNEAEDPLPEDITFTESVNHANENRNKRVQETTKEDIEDEAPSSPMAITEPAEEENILPFQPDLSTNEYKDVGDERNEIKRNYYKEKLELMRQKLQLKEREVSALERIAVCVEEYTVMSAFNESQGSVKNGCNGVNKR